MKTNIFNTFFVSILLSIFLFACATIPEESERDTKMKAIEKYLTIVPMQEMMNDLAIKLAKTVPEENREAFIDILTKRLNIKILEDAVKVSMYKHFSLREIETLTDFYSKPEGRSVMKKLGDYMADVMPIIQSELMRAIKEQQQKQ